MRLFKAEKAHMAYFFITPSECRKSQVKITPFSVLVRVAGGGAGKQSQRPGARMSCSSRI